MKTHLHDLRTTLFSLFPSRLKSDVLSLAVLLVVGVLVNAAGVGDTPSTTTTPAAAHRHERDHPVSCCSSPLVIALLWRPYEGTVVWHNGVVVGDGALVATTAGLLCVEKDKSQVLKPGWALFASAERGELCVGSLLAIDYGRNLAWWEVPWQGHSVYPLCSGKEITSLKDVRILSRCYDETRIEEGPRIVATTERIAYALEEGGRPIALALDRGSSSQDILSGSAILTATGRLVGLMGTNLKTSFRVGSIRTEKRGIVVSVEAMARSLVATRLDRALMPVADSLGASAKADPRFPLVARALLSLCVPMSEGRPFLEAAAADSERPGTAMCLLALSHIAHEEYELAQHVLDSVFRQDPVHPLASYLRAGAHLENGETEQANRTLRKSLAVHPNEPMLMKLALHTRSSDEAFDDRRELLERMVAHWPEFARYHGMLGDEHRKHGKLAAAQQAYRKALDWWPEWPEPRLFLAALLAEEGDFESARELLQKGLDCLPGHQQFMILIEAIPPEQEPIRSTKKEKGRAPALDDEAEELWLNPWYAPSVKIRVRAVTGEREGNAFVVGDGTLAVTAAHIVRQPTRSGLLRTPQIVSVSSRAWGDAGIARVVAVDEKNDLALLELPWRGHPAYLICADDELQSLDQVSLVALPQGDAPALECHVYTPKFRVRGDVRLQLRLQGKHPVEDGWSGSAILSPSRRVVGLFSGFSEIGKGRRRQPGLGSCRAFGATAVQILQLAKRARVEHRLSPAGVEPLILADALMATKLFRAATRTEGNSPSDRFDAARKLVQVRSRSVAAWSVLAQAAIEVGALDEVARACKQILAVGGESSFGHLSAGSLFMQRGDMRNARKHFQRAVELDSENAMAWVLLAGPGSVVQPDGGRALCEQATTAFPDYYYFHGALGDRLRKSGETAHAVEAYQRALAIWPDWYPARKQLAECLEKLGRNHEAEDAWRRLMESHPSKKTPYLRLARFLHGLSSSNAAEATTILNRGLDALELGEKDRMQFRDLLDAISSRTERRHP